MVEQEVPEDAVIVPDLDEDDRQAIRDEVREAAAKKERKPRKRCIVCGKPATHCMRGLPNNTYCKECAKDYFKFLSYLERL